MTLFEGAETSPRSADLVMEGGGVKGVALGGVLIELVAAGYRFPRVAGTSAGAITGALVAGMQKAGESPDRVLEVAATLDLTKFRDSGRVGKMLGPLHGIADVASLLVSGGLYEGQYLEDWLGGVLADLGVRTFGDLRREDPGSALPPEREYGLVVVTSDLSRHRMTLLPWDCAGYGLDPDEFSVARAVRASCSLPFIFELPRLAVPGRGSFSLADGGLLSNYPITIFDQPDRAEARWPTIGVRLSAREDVPAVAKPVRTIWEIGIALVETALQGVDARHVDDPDAARRTIFVDTGGIRATEFDISDEQREGLVAWGRSAARKWLAAQAASEGDPGGHTDSEL